jgi:hypothetical protein
MTDVITGACLCEGVRFEVTPPTKWCAHCHCSMCRRAHGASVVTWFGARSQSLRLLAGPDLLKWYQSSPQARRGFCSHCGSMLFFEGERWPGETHVARASVPGRIDREPAAHVYFDVHVDWLQFNDSLRKLGGSTGNQPLEP